MGLKRHGPPLAAHHRRYPDWVEHGTGLELGRKAPPVPGLPTDAELDAVAVAAGFQAPAGPPYRRHLRLVRADG